MGSKSKFHVDVMPLFNEVTGSCHLCVVTTPDKNTFKFIVDCGLFQEKQYLTLNDTIPFKPESLSFALITHNHIDHIGRLPLLVKLGFSNTIYTSNLTKVFMPKSLMNSCKILIKTAKVKKTKPLYSIKDLDKTLKLTEGVAYFNEIRVHENVSVTFLDNGHMPGSSMILVKIFYPGEQDIFMLFTGDYSSHSPFFNVGEIPKYIFDLPLTIIQESTYGNTYLKDVIPVFKDNIINAINEKKTVIIPAFSFGRSQEILLNIRKMQDSGILDKNLPVYLDGKLSICYTNIFCDISESFKEEARDFIPYNFSFLTKELRAQLLIDTNCKIIVTSSGMGSYGPAPLYISKYIERDDSLIHFVGYPAKGTLSKILMDTEKHQFVNFKNVEKKKLCDIKHSTEFSSHAKLDEILNFLKRFTNIKLLLINHGEYECKYNLEKTAKDNNLSKDVFVESILYFYRIDAYGLVKILTTKF